MLEKKITIRKYKKCIYTAFADRKKYQLLENVFAREKSLLQEMTITVNTIHIKKY